MCFACLDDWKGKEGVCPPISEEEKAMIDALDDHCTVPTSSICTGRPPEPPPGLGRPPPSPPQEQLALRDGHMADDVEDPRIDNLMNRVNELEETVARLMSCRLMSRVNELEETVAQMQQQMQEDRESGSWWPRTSRPRHDS